MAPITPAALARLFECLQRQVLQTNRFDPAAVQKLFESLLRLLPLLRSNAPDVCNLRTSQRATYSKRAPSLGPADFQETHLAFGFFLDQTVHSFAVAQNDLIELPSGKVPDALGQRP